MHVGIIELTTVLPGLEGKPTAGHQIADWLLRAMPRDKMQVFPVGGGMELPDIARCDGFVISGSGMGVYDTPDWMEPLRGFLLAAKAAGKPLVGICFGHQIMADTFGGKAEKAALGKVIGVRRFRIEGVDYPAHVWHQDQVTGIPPGAKVVGVADHCPIGALEYEFPAWSVQFHPEYTKDTILAEITAACPQFVPEEILHAAVKEISAAEVSVDLMAVKAAEVLRGGSSADLSGKAKT